MVKKALTLLTSILFALPLLMPFNIYANTEHQIVPTWSQSSQQTQWANKFVVTNYCESSNNPQNYSCQLTITVNGDYYGYVYFDGYINNQIIFDYQTMFISGGKGTFYYTWYQNGLKEINKVNIAGLSLITPTDNIDFTQIIDLLTSINSYSQQMEGNQDTQIQELQTVINDLIVSNGYLEALTKLRQFNIPFESFSFNYYLLNNYSTFTKEYFDKYVYISQYPVFNTELDKPIYKTFLNSNPNNFNHTQTFIMVTDLNVSGANQIPIQFDIDTTKYSISNYQYLNYYNGYFLVRFDITASVTGDFELIPTVANRKIIGIFANYTKFNSQVSTDFALKYGLTNKLLDDLNIIANGTVESNSAAQSSDSANSQLQTDSNTLFQQENGFKSDMNNAMQNVNTTFRLQDMGTKFVSSAQWVRSQYESLTNNTPFASLITFSLITGLALILLGKVYK